METIYFCSIIETSISKDILMLPGLKGLHYWRRLIRFLMWLYSGQILSYNKILGQFNASGNTTTLSHYLTCLTGRILAGNEKFLFL